MKTQEQLHDETLYCLELMEHFEDNCPDKARHLSQIEHDMVEELQAIERLYVGMYDKIINDYTALASEVIRG